MTVNPSRRKSGVNELDRASIKRLIDSLVFYCQISGSKLVSETQKWVSQKIFVFLLRFYFWEGLAGQIVLSVVSAKMLFLVSTVFSLNGSLL